MTRTSLLMALLLLASSAQAETAYVTERLTVPLRSAAAEPANTVKLLEAGAPLEVLERAGLHARVRDRAGAEGWIEARLLGAEQPARAQLGRLGDELKQARAQLAEAQAQVKKLDGLLAQETAKSKDLAAKAAAAASASPPAPAPEAAPAASAPSPAEASEAGGERTPVLVWLGVCFAMLVAGFFGGQYWLRESIRRRSGGMYLRV